MIAARALFVDKGYAATGTPELVERAGVTRGALYHHFADKQDLFLAVVQAEATQIAADIQAGAKDAETPLAALEQGARSYFAAMRDPGRVRLMLLEGPAVLGVAAMRQIDLETGGRELRLGLAEALGKGASDAQVEVMADLISAMFDRAVIAGQAGADVADYARVIRRLLRTLIGG